MGTVHPQYVIVGTCKFTHQSMTVLQKENGDYFCSSCGQQIDGETTPISREDPLPDAYTGG